MKVSAEVAKIDLIYAAIFHGPIVLAVYLNLHFLVPDFLEKERYFLYAISITATISASSGFYLLLFEKWIDHLLEGYYFIAYYNFWDISLYFSVYLLLTTLIRLARSWFRLNDAEKEKTLTELKALRSQLNPHFLFNSLNSIYSLARKKSDFTPEAVLELSDVLRYVIYDAETSLIDLNDELDFLDKYIKLQKLRLNDSSQVEVTREVAPNELQIAPLLFLPFIENAFKYAPQSQTENNQIKIDFRIKSKKIHFHISNAVGKPSVQEEDRYKGFGIQNVVKRLELLYPNKHELKINQQNGQFIVDLIVEIK